MVKHSICNLSHNGLKVFRTFPVTQGQTERGLVKHQPQPKQGTPHTISGSFAIQNTWSRSVLFNTLGPKAFYLTESTLKCLSIKIKKAWRKNHESLILFHVHIDILSASLKLGLKGKTLLTFQSTTSLHFKYLAILIAQIYKGNPTLCFSTGSCILRYFENIFPLRIMHISQNKCSCKTWVLNCKI